LSSSVGLNLKSRIISEHMNMTKPNFRNVLRLQTGKFHRD